MSVIGLIIHTTQEDIKQPDVYHLQQSKISWHNNKFVSFVGKKTKDLKKWIGIWNEM
jgi:hypothetical protein